MQRPNILFLMTDQQRADTVRALGNPYIHTPHLDRIAERGVSFTNAYSTCPVCVPARYTIRTGCEPPRTRVFTNTPSAPLPGQPAGMEARCGTYLARFLHGAGYRTFGIGKFHAEPWDEDLGYEVHLHSEPLYVSHDQRHRDAYAAWIRTRHPEYDFIETLMGEHTEMYYMPQTSPLPAACTVESWAADRAIEQVRVKDRRPFFGFVSFVGPHPPFAPPIPYNRMYDPDSLPSPGKGNPEIDMLDDQIPWMNHAVWAEEINEPHARVLKARYYGEISFIDDCIGRILNALEEEGMLEDTLICFFSDHGDMLGDHGAWQKECFFEASCRVPFLLSWPGVLPGGESRSELVCLADLFGIASRAAGMPEYREGADVIGMIEGKTSPRSLLVGIYREPGTRRFKVMVRSGPWKYVFMANGGHELLFNLDSDPGEEVNRASDAPGVLNTLRHEATAALRTSGAAAALEGDGLKRFAFEKRKRTRILQFDRSRGIYGFPERPGEVFTLFPPVTPGRKGNGGEEERT